MNLRAGVAERVIKGVAYQLIGSFSWRKKEDEKSIKAFSVPFVQSPSFFCVVARYLLSIWMEAQRASLLSRFVRWHCR